MVDLLKEGGAEHIKVFGGGGGVIVPEEIKELEAYGVSKIYTPEDGTSMGLQGIINHMVQMMDYSRADETLPGSVRPGPDNKLLVANLITTLEQAKARENGHLAPISTETQRKNR
jgi:methylmalonyl-CoA mutase